MTINPDPTAAETLRSLAASTVRGVLQTAGVQSISSEIRQQSVAVKSAGVASNSNNQSNTANGTNTSSVKVELSAAAKFPPLASISASAASTTHPYDMVLSAALPLPSSLGLLSAGSQQEKMREVLQLALKIGQNINEGLSTTTIPVHHAESTNSTRLMTGTLVASAFAIAQYAGLKPWKETSKLSETRESPGSLLSSSGFLMTAKHGSDSISSEQNSSILLKPATEAHVDGIKPEVSSTRSEQQKVEALYAQSGIQSYVRLDLSPLPTESPASKIEEGAFAVTLQVKLPVLGDILITMAFNETRSDLAFAASPSAVELLKLTQTEFRQAAAGWGLNLHGLSFIPFVQHKDKG